MNTYIITFRPLAAAKLRWQKPYIAEVDADAQEAALRVAERMLEDDGYKRKDFRKRPTIECSQDNLDSDTEWDSLTIEHGAPDWTLASLNQRLAALRSGETFYIDNLSDELYHSCDGFSCSQLKVFLKCPRKFWAKYIAEITREPDKAYFDFGKAAHAAVLEPWRLETDFVRQPDEIKVRRGAKWDELKAQAESSRQTVLTVDQHEDVMMLRDAVKQCEALDTLCRRGVVERSIFTRDKETGLLMKVRPDYVRGCVLTDIKTTADGSPLAFTRTAKRLGYHIQDAMYSDVAGAELFVFVAIESERPFVVTAPVVMSDAMKRLGYLLYRKAINGIKACLETGIWAPYTELDVEIDIAPWEQELLYELEAEQLNKEDAA